MLRLSAILIAAVFATSMPARSSPDVDFGWLQGNWSCDDGGYTVPVVARAVGPSSMTVSWQTEADDVRYELRRQHDGTWTLSGRAQQRATPDFVGWNLKQRGGRTGDVTFVGTARFAKAHEPFQAAIKWWIVRTDRDEMAQWRWYSSGDQWTNAQSRHCRRDAAKP
jgi:hypothetical protein